MARPTAPAVPARSAHCAADAKCEPASAGLVKSAAKPSAVCLMALTAASLAMAASCAASSLRMTAGPVFPIRTYCSTTEPSESAKLEMACVRMPSSGWMDASIDSVTLVTDA